MAERNKKKGGYVIEPSIAMSEFVEKINKLSYHDFPEKEIFKILQKNSFSLDLLEPYTFFSNARYTRNLIHKDPAFELTLMCFNPGQHSAIINHDGEKCFFRIELGTLSIINYQKEATGAQSLLKKLTTQKVNAGSIDGPVSIHQAINNTDKQVISLQLSTNPCKEYIVYDLKTNQIIKTPLGYHSIHGKLVAPEETR